MPWLEEFREQTLPVIAEPLLGCLAEAIAIVESDHGRKAIRTDQGFNEIGYKALAGYPKTSRQTQEANAQGALLTTSADFRLFRDRAEQARALLWLMRSSCYYETCRLLFILAFYSAYAPGRTAGLRALLGVFNELALSGAHPGVRPLALIRDGNNEPLPMDAECAALNHAAARQAVQLFAELTLSAKSPG